MGILSPIGNNLSENLDAIKSGKCGIAPITYFDTENSKVKVAGELKNCELSDYLPVKEVKREDRFVSLAMIAAKEAMMDSNLLEYEEWDKDRAGTLIATGIGGLVSIEQQHSRLLEQGMRGITPFFVPGAISNIAAAKIYAEVVGYATNSDAYFVGKDILRHILEKNPQYLWAARLLF